MSLSAACTGVLTHASAQLKEERRPYLRYGDTVRLLTKGADGTDLSLVPDDGYFVCAPGTPPGCLGEFRVCPREGKAPGDFVCFADTFALAYESSVEGEPVDLYVGVDADAYLTTVAADGAATFRCALPGHALPPPCPDPVAPYRLSTAPAPQRRRRTHRSATLRNTTPTASGGVPLAATALISSRLNHSHAQLPARAALGHVPQSDEPAVLSGMRGAARLARRVACPQRCVTNKPPIVPLVLFVRRACRPVPRERARGLLVAARRARKRCFLFAARPKANHACCSEAHRIPHTVHSE